ncbi:MAG: TauD/TfdA family dioxygenase [Alphaproteobacteria bacterium]|nr:TauD/TfdA family dioxygenase [Alphaproteobacteria bacterium]
MPDGFKLEPDANPVLTPIEGPAAWRGADLAGNPDWRRSLTDREVAALMRAAEESRARGAGPTGFGADRFAIPELAPVLGWLAEQLERGPGVARLCGFPVERVSRDELRRMFWGFCANLGTPIYQTAAGEILGEVKDETGSGAALTYDGPGPLKSARTVARSTGALRFHTDKTDLVCLLCASNGIAGGISKVVSSVTLHNEIARRRPDLLRVLYQPFWRMRPADEEGERDDRVFAMPVFARGPDGGFTSQYSRTYINQAQEVPGVPPLTEAQNEAMDMIHAIGEEVCLQMPFVPGEVQFMNQHVTYHGRTAFTDDPQSGAQRVLLRIWLSVPFSRALPAGHAVQWGDVRAGALRGGAVVGRSAIGA